MIAIVLLMGPRSTKGPILNIIKGKKSLLIQVSDTEVAQVHWTHSIRDISTDWVWNDADICLEKCSAMNTPSRLCWRGVISCFHANLSSTKSPAVSVFFVVVLAYYQGTCPYSAVTECKMIEAHITKSFQMSLVYSLL